MPRWSAGPGGNCRSRCTLRAAPATRDRYPCTQGRSLSTWPFDNGSDGAVAPRTSRCRKSNAMSPTPATRRVGSCRSHATTSETRGTAAAEDRLEAAVARSPLAGMSRSGPPGHTRRVPSRAGTIRAAPSRRPSIARPMPRLRFWESNRGPRQSHSVDTNRFAGGPRRRRRSPRGPSPNRANNGRGRPTQLQSRRAPDFVERRRWLLRTPTRHVVTYPVSLRTRVPRPAVPPSGARAPARHSYRARVRETPAARRDSRGRVDRPGHAVATGYPRAVFARPPCPGDQAQTKPKDRGPHQRRHGLSGTADRTCQSRAPPGRAKGDNRCARVGTWNAQVCTSGIFVLCKNRQDVRVE